MNIGIDLGTTFSLVGQIDPNGEAVLVPDVNVRELVHTPSVVYLHDGRAFVGHVVEDLVEQDPNIKPIRYFKRRFGESSPIAYDSEHREWYAESIAALLLKKLVHDAEKSSTREVEGAVVTVPAHFNGVQRKAVLAAGALADLPVLALLEEPVAAALAYGVKAKSRDDIILVYDFGGGTFDVTLMTMNQAALFVMGTGGEPELGGKEFDDAIAAMILDQFTRAGSPISVTPAVVSQLRVVSQQLKIDICMPGKTFVRQAVVLGNRSVDVRIQRSDFEREVETLVERAERSMLKCVKDAGVALSDVTTVIMVGGTSMVPLVGARLRRLLGADASRLKYYQPTKAVAFGAALHTAQLEGRASFAGVPAELRGATGYAVGVRIKDVEAGTVRVDPIIPRNIGLPVRANRTYYTTSAQQDRMVLDFVQYRDSEADAIHLGKLTVGPLASPRQNYPIEVDVDYRIDGTVAVSARDPQTGQELKHTFRRDARDDLGYLASQRALVRGTPINL